MKEVSHHREAAATSAAETVQEYEAAFEREAACGVVKAALTMATAELVDELTNRDLAAVKNSTRAQLVDASATVVQELARGELDAMQQRAQMAEAAQAAEKQVEQLLTMEASRSAVRSAILMAEVATVEAWASEDVSEAKRGQAQAETAAALANSKVEQSEAAAAIM
eukprot:2074563-Prymnesium_polylepis.1